VKADARVEEVQRSFLRLNLDQGQVSDRSSWTNRQCNHVTSGNCRESRNTRAYSSLTLTSPFLIVLAEVTPKNALDFATNFRPSTPVSNCSCGGNSQERVGFRDKLPPVYARLRPSPTVLAGGNSQETRWISRQTSARLRPSPTVPAEVTPKKPVGFRIRT
jgi:hypothetical protein